MWRNFQGKGLIWIWNIEHHLIKRFCGEGCQKAALSHRISFRKKYTRNGFRFSPEASAHSEAFRGLQKCQLRNSERNGITWKYLNYKKSCSSKQDWERVFVRETFGSGIPRVCFYFCSTERNSELFSLPRNVSERNSENLILFLFLSTEFQAFFSSAEWFGMEFREISVPRNSRNSARTNQLFRLFRRPRNNFFVGTYPCHVPIFLMLPFVFLMTTFATSSFLLSCS